MSQRNIINHFLGNGNGWETATSLQQGFGCSASLGRMFDMVERRFDGRRTLYRLKEAIFSELREARRL